MLCQNIDRCRHSTRARTRFMRIHACTDVATSRCASAHRCGRTGRHQRPTHARARTQTREETHFALGIEGVWIKDRGVLLVEIACEVRGIVRAGISLLLCPTPASRVRSQSHARRRARARSERDLPRQTIRRWQTAPQFPRAAHGQRRAVRIGPGARAHAYRPAEGCASWRTLTARVRDQVRRARESAPRR